MKGFKRLKNIILYSDSEPNEILIAMCHLICLPLAILVDFEIPNLFLMIIAMISGLYQLYATLWCDCINKRLFAVQFASLIAIGTIYNLVNQGILIGSRTGWLIIMVFSFWNVIRVFLEKINRNG